MGGEVGSRCDPSFAACESGPFSEWRVIRPEGGSTAGGWPSAVLLRYSEKAAAARTAGTRARSWVETSTSAENSYFE